MSEYTNLRPSTPTPAAPAGPGKLVESRGVEPLTVSTGATSTPTPVQPRRQRWALPAGLTEGDLQRGYAQAVRP